MSRITTHVLDLAQGRPAAGVDVVLQRQDDDAWTVLARGRTNDDGRVADLLPADDPITPGTYRISFSTGEYFARQGVDSFHPAVEVAFRVTDDREHYHVPLLLSPFGYSTYRGS